MGQVVFLRKKAVLSLRPDIKIKSIRGTIPDRIRQYENGDYDAIIVATVALKRLGLEKYIKEIMPWQTMPLQGQLAVVGRKDNLVLKELLAPIDVRKSYGRVFLVGAGPGDPELITLKAIRILSTADIVFYDFLVDKDLLKYASQAELSYIGKRKGKHSITQKALNARLCESALDGKIVVRLKCGDPLVFGRGSEEIDYLRSFHIEVEVIPGLSAGMSVISSLGIPLTARGISRDVGFVSGYSRGEKNSESPVRIPDTDTIVFFMGLSKIDKIVEALRGKGFSEKTSVAIISRGTQPDQKVIIATMDVIEEKVYEVKLLSPAIVVVGNVLQFYREDLKILPSLLFTGTHPEQYEAIGHITHFPMIKISGMIFSDEEIDLLLKDIYECDIVLFTSMYGVKYFFDFLRKNGDDKVLMGKLFFVIGHHTADALIDHGFSPALISHIETSEGLAAMFKGNKEDQIRNKKIIFPRSSLPNSYLKDTLGKMGAEVKEVTIYQNNKTEKKELIKENIDGIFFTSPSTVKNFLEDYERIPSAWNVFSKGLVTKRYLKEVGYDSQIL